MLLSLPAMVTAFLLVGCLQEMSAERRTVTVEVTVPDPAWKVIIDRIYLAEDRLVVVSNLHRQKDVVAAQVISKATDSVRVQAPDLPIEHYIFGKTWNWTEEPHQFIEEPGELEKKVARARLLYERKK